MRLGTYREESWARWADDLKILVASPAYQDLMAQSYWFDCLVLHRGMAKNDPDVWSKLSLGFMVMIQERMASGVTMIVFNATI